MVHIIMQRSKKKYNFNTYLHFDAVTVSHPENQESASHVYFGIVISTSSVNHPPVLERGNKRPSFQLTTIEIASYTPTDVDCVYTSRHAT